MKLFLASLIKHPKTFKHLESYVAGFTGKSIAYIPTAANGEGWQSWKCGDSWNILQSLESRVTVVQLEDYGKKDIITVLKGNDIVWVSGGMTGYLMYWIRRVKLDQAIHELLQNTIYVGSSAGSMICGQTLQICDWFPGDEEPGAGIFPGLKLVNFDLFPHYNDDALEIIRKEYTGKALYLLKDGEEIIVDDGKVEVVGETRLITT